MRRPDRIQQKRRPQGPPFCLLNVVEVRGFFLGRSPAASNGVRLSIAGKNSATHREPLSADEGVKPTVFDALICMAAPVFGLRPMRAARFLTLNVPNPISWTFPSFLTPLATASSTALTASSAARLDVSLPRAFCTASTSSPLFIGFSFKSARPFRKAPTSMKMIKRAKISHFSPKKRPKTPAFLFTTYPLPP